MLEFFLIWASFFILSLGLWFQPVTRAMLDGFLFALMCVLAAYLFGWL